jgi:hypothetical protein
VSQIEGLEALLGNSMLNLALQVDAAIDRAVDLGLPMETTSVRQDELEMLPGDLLTISRQVGAQVSDESFALIQQLSEALGRKIQGAKDALEYSADPVSQAANSLIELIDRLLSGAFVDVEVLDWIEVSCPQRMSELTYVDNATSRRSPTKRAQALCFVFAGQPIGEPSMLHEAVAAAIAAARQQLQKLKHSDTGTEDERLQLLDRLATIEGFVLFVCRVAWIGAPEASLQSLRQRLDLPGR